MIGIVATIFNDKQILHQGTKQFEPEISDGRSNLSAVSCKSSLNQSNFMGSAVTGT